MLKVTVRSQLVGALLCAGVAASAINPAAAESSGPFQDLSGSWVGDGAVRGSNGDTQRLRCEAKYVANGDDGLDQDLQCSSDNYNFRFQVNLTSQGGAIVGNWRELTRNLEGGISGHGSKDLIQVVVRGQAFTASDSVTTHGSQQSVKIRSQSAEFSDVSMALHRSH